MNNRPHLKTILKDKITLSENKSGLESVQILNVYKSTTVQILYTPFRTFVFKYERLFLIPNVCF